MLSTVFESSSALSVQKSDLLWAAVLAQQSQTDRALLSRIIELPRHLESPFYLVLKCLSSVTPPFIVKVTLNRELSTFSSLYSCCWCTLTSTWVRRTASRTPQGTSPSGTTTVSNCSTCRKATTGSCDFTEHEKFRIFWSNKDLFRCFWCSVLQLKLGYLFLQYHRILNKNCLGLWASGVFRWSLSGQTWSLSWWASGCS